MANKDLVFPVVHNNGSGGSALRNQAQKAYEAVSMAMEMLNEAAPHGRDYYTLDAGAVMGESYQKAQAQWRMRMMALENVRDDLRLIYDNIDGQVYQSAVDKMFIA